MKETNKKPGQKPNKKPDIAADKKKAKKNAIKKAADKAAKKEAKRGTVVTCPRKRHKIGTAKIPISYQARISVHNFDFEPGQECVPGDMMKCKICGSLYFRDGKIHTENGWIPDDPRLEPVSL